MRKSNVVIVESNSHGVQRLTERKRTQTFPLVLRSLNIVTHGHNFTLRGPRRPVRFGTSVFEEVERKKDKGKNNGMREMRRNPRGSD